jgi:hypothetical protein
VGVDDEREEHQALPAPKVGDVGDPQPVGRLDGEVPLDQIGPAVRVRVGLRGAPRPPATLGANDPVHAHQPLDPAARDLLAGAQERLPHPPVAVGAVVGFMHLADASQQPLVLDGSRAALAAGALVVGGRRHAQDPADRLDAETAAVLIDEAAHFGRSASSSVAKNTDAA